MELKPLLSSSSESTSSSSLSTSSSSPPSASSSPCIALRFRNIVSIVNTRCASAFFASRLLKGVCKTSVNNRSTRLLLGFVCFVYTTSMLGKESYPNAVKTIWRNDVEMSVPLESVPLDSVPLYSVPLLKASIMFIASRLYVFFGNGKSP